MIKRVPKPERVRELIEERQATVPRTSPNWTRVVARWLRAGATHFSALNPGRVSRILESMEVHLTRETERKLKDLAATTGRRTDDLVEDAMAGYVEELLQAREMLNNRYDELKSGRVKPIDGEEAFARLRANTEAQRKRRA